MVETLPYAMNRFIAMTRIAYLVGLVISMSVCSGCVLKGSFNPPRNLPPIHNNEKRLIIFQGTDIPRLNNNTEVLSGVTLLAIPSSNKRILRLRGVNAGTVSYVLDIKEQDTGYLRFILGGERPIGRKRFFADTALSFKDLEMGTNYWHLNCYTKQFAPGDWRLVIGVRKIDIEKDIFRFGHTTRFRHLLTYDVSNDSVIFSRKKYIAGKQAKNERAYNRILSRNKSLNSVYHPK